MTISKTGLSAIPGLSAKSNSSKEEASRRFHAHHFEPDNSILSNLQDKVIEMPPLARDYLEGHAQSAHGDRDRGAQPKVKILIVDDHTMTRIGLRLALGTQKNYEVIGEAAAGTKALEQVGELEPDLILMDVHLPDTSGIDISRRVLESYPRTKVMIISSDVSRNMVDKALEIGVCGYLSKGSSVEELLKAIEAVLAGKLYFCAEASGQILRDYRCSLREKAKGKTSLVSEHEKALLRLISRGLRNKEIASELHVSGKSVEAYRSRLMKKLHCSSPAELVLYAVREGITRA